MKVDNITKNICQPIEINILALKEILQEENFSVNSYRQYAEYEILLQSNSMRTKILFFYETGNPKVRVRCCRNTRTGARYIVIQ